MRVHDRLSFMDPKELREKLNILLSHDAMETREYRRLARAANRLRMSKEQILGNNSDQGKWKTFSLFDKFEEEENIVQEEGMEDKLNRLDEEHKSYIGAVHRQEDQLKKLLEKRSNEAPLPSFHERNRIRAHRRELQEYLDENGPAEERQAILDNAEAWFREYTNNQKKYRYKLLAVENAITNQRKKQAEFDEEHCYNSYKEDLNTKHTILNKSVELLKQCHRELKNKVVRPEDQSLYEQCNMKFRENNTLLQQLVHVKSKLRETTVEKDVKIHHLEDALHQFRVYGVEKAELQEKASAECQAALKQLDQMRCTWDRYQMEIEDFTRKYYPRIDRLIDALQSQNCLLQKQKADSDQRAQECQSEAAKYQSKYEVAQNEVVILKHRVHELMQLLDAPKEASMAPDISSVSQKDPVVASSATDSLLEQEIHALRRHCAKLEARLAFVTRKTVASKTIDLKLPVNPCTPHHDKFSPRKMKSKELQKKSQPLQLDVRLPLTAALRKEIFPAACADPEDVPDNPISLIEQIERLTAENEKLRKKQRQKTIEQPPIDPDVIQVIPVAAPYRYPSKSFEKIERELILPKTAKLKMAAASHEKPTSSRMRKKRPGTAPSHRRSMFEAIVFQK